MPEGRDEDTGQFEQVYDEGRICDLLRDTRLSTSEVADKLDCHRTTAHRRLREIEEEGKIQSTQVGNTLLWELN